MSIRHRSRLAIVLLAGLVSAQQEPCAQLSASITDDSVPAGLAVECLRSVPLQTDSVLTQLTGLELLTTFQSDLYYLNNSEPARLYPGVDLLGGLRTLRERAQGDYYSNEYDLQLDLAKLYASAYDGHLQYLPDIIGSFGFTRTGPAGERFPLISISSDGQALPSVYGYQDRFILGTPGVRATYQPTPVVQIDGIDVEEWLREHAAASASYQDPDANYNFLFPNQLSPGRGSTFEAFLYYNGTGETVLRFENDTETRLQIRAVPNQVNLSGLTDGASFFDRCCSGSRSVGGGTVIFAPGGPSSLTAQELITRNLAPERPALREQFLEKRQSGSSSDDTFPEPIVSLNLGGGRGSVAGYFPEEANDLAVLTIPTFNLDLSDVSAYQEVITDFLEAAREADKTRLVIDLRGNTGGLVFLAHDTFGQLFPEAVPYDTANYRASPFFDFAGRVYSEAFANINSASFDDALDAPPFFVNPYPFNYRTQLDENNQTFSSWPDLFGPADTPSLDNFTSLLRPNISNILQTVFPVWPLGRPASVLSRPQAFAAENITLLQDGGCASTCVNFAEFLRANAPGPGRVRQVVIGGRRQTGPMQGTGGIKGGQQGLLAVLGAAVAQAVAIGGREQLETLSSSVEDPQTAIRAASVALARAAPLPGSGAAGSVLQPSLPAASVNFRNSIRQGDASLLPLQYVYEAADCRLWYTAAMYLDQSAVWGAVYDAAFGEGQCVEGSEGHASAEFGTDYASIQIPEGARSQVAIRGSGDLGAVRQADGGAGGGSGSGSGGGAADGGDAEGAAAASRRVGSGMQAVALLVAVVACVLMV